MHDSVREYYGKILQSKDDLQTSACCTDTDLPSGLKAILGQIHDEVASRYYGCGLIAPADLRGCRILDLGSGSGRDAYVLSALVGAEGEVVGVDMTPEQLAIANRHIEYHQKQFGYAKPNVRFYEGYIERLDALPLEPESFDVIVSNCVINLSPDKESVFRQAHRLLKPGGELYFSDVYADRRVPSHLKEDPVLYGECLSGAMYWNDFLDIAKRTGFLDPRLVEDRPLTIEQEAIVQKIGHIGFYSATYRLFKLADLESACEDWGQAVRYRGGLEGQEQMFVLDAHHHIDRGRVFPVCGNTWRMLHDTRFRRHFEFIGNWETHYGIFADCGTSIPFDESRDPSDTSGACC
ncbi:MAG: methyltransferase domain-containing protein [Gemmatimonadetes bacterium]|nr:methyltransferase domain-containing protein [Gemmatimonadota bacterium]